VNVKLLDVEYIEEKGAVNDASSFKLELEFSNGYRGTLSLLDSGHFSLNQGDLFNTFALTLDGIEWDGGFVISSEVLFAELVKSGNFEILPEEQRVPSIPMSFAEGLVLSISESINENRPDLLSGYVNGWLQQIDNPKLLTKSSTISELIEACGKVVKHNE